MITLALLQDAVDGVFKMRGVTVGVSALQRKIRVGFATAQQLAEALESAGVLGELRSDGRRLINAHDAQWGHRLVAEAIEDGRIALTPVASAIDPANHAFRSLNGAGRCAAIVGPLDSGQACGLSPEAHQASTNSETSSSGGRS